MEAKQRRGNERYMYTKQYDDDNYMSMEDKRSTYMYMYAVHMYMYYKTQ